MFRSAQHDHKGHRHSEGRMSRRIFSEMSSLPNEVRDKRSSIFQNNKTSPPKTLRPLNDETALFHKRAVHIIELEVKKDVVKTVQRDTYFTPFSIGDRRLITDFGPF